MSKLAGFIYLLNHFVITQCNRHRHVLWFIPSVSAAKVVILGSGYNPGLVATQMQDTRLSVQKFGISP